MGDAITNTIAYRRSIARGHAALRSGALSELRQALALLPDDGSEDAEVVRERIRAALDKAKSEPLPDGDCSNDVLMIVCDGVGYRFRKSEIAATTFFTAQNRGAYIDIAINTAHPFGSRVAQSLGENPPLMAMIAAWAHNEVEQTNTVRADMVNDTREDWSRTLRRIVSCDDGSCWL